jgi:hypothetical protein
VFDKLTGRAVSDGGSALPEFLTPITRGPMKDRTFNIPDALVTPFLDSNVLGRRGALRPHHGSGDGANPALRPRRHARADRPHPAPTIADLRAGGRFPTRPG